MPLDEGLGAVYSKFQWQELPLLLIKYKKRLVNWPLHCPVPARNENLIFMNNKLWLCRVGESLFHRYGAHVKEEDMIAIEDMGGTPAPAFAGCTNSSTIQMTARLRKCLLRRRTGTTSSFGAI